MIRVQLPRDRQRLATRARLRVREQHLLLHRDVPEQTGAKFRVSLHIDRLARDRSVECKIEARVVL
jgi:hypothetical protein